MIRWCISCYIEGHNHTQATQLLSTSVYMLTAAALIASPGPRHGRPGRVPGR